MKQFAREFEHERQLMVQRQLRGGGIADERVLGAMARVPRHRLLPERQWGDAYQPRAIRIAAGQTMSQPFMVGRMTELLQLEGGESVLEIGTGSGYQAAILAELGCRVVSVERVPELAESAREGLARLGVEGVELLVADGSVGDPRGRRFDRIVVTAASPGVPGELLEQLDDPGRLVCPVGDRDLQELAIVHREGGEDRVEHTVPCSFVPLLGEGGFAPGA